MAIKIRDSFVIGEVGNYMQQASQELRSDKAKILRDINNMFTKYKGSDADVIRAKFEEAINRMDSLIERFDYYSNYMQNVSRHDKENIQNANKQINSIINEPVSSNPNVNIDNLDDINQTIEISDLNGGEEHAI